MKIRTLFTLTLLAILAFGCTKEVIVPENDAPTAFGSIDGHVRPAQQCGASAFSTLKSGAISYGTIEILNDAEQLYILTDMNNGWLLQDVKIFAGATIDIPKGNGGIIQTEEFPLQVLQTPMADKATYTLPTYGLGASYGVTMWARVAHVNMFGQVTGTVDVWLDGPAVLDGFSYIYTAGACGVVQVANQVTI